MNATNLLKYQKLNITQVVELWYFILAAVMDSLAPLGPMSWSLQSVYPDYSSISLVYDGISLVNDLTFRLDY